MFEKETKQNFIKTHEKLTECNYNILDIHDYIKALDKIGYNINTEKYFEKLAEIQKLLAELKTINNDEYNKIFK